MCSAAAPRRRPRRDHGTDRSTPRWLRGMTMPRISRRDALRGGALLSASAFLAACGVQGTSGDDAPQASGFWASQTKAGQLDFANWPLYMDTAKVGGKTVHPSLQAFTKETGIKVNYKEAIEDNDSFLGKINPSLQAGQDPGWDLIVITDGGSIEKLIRQNFLDRARPLQAAQLRQERRPRGQEPGLRPGQQVHHGLAVGPGRAGLQPQADQAARSPATRTSSTRPSRARSPCSATTPTSRRWP